MNCGIDQILSLMPDPLRGWLTALPCRTKSMIREIRLHAGQPVFLQMDGESRFLTAQGLKELPSVTDYRADRSLLEQLFPALCRYGVHTHQQELSRGYISLPYGHRAGISGTGVWSEGRLSTLRQISGINIRIAHEVSGAADALLGMWNGQGNLLLAGPPGSGKTTILRDVAAQLGGGKRGAPRKITLIDERGEIAGCTEGNPAFSIGLCTDVLTGIPKAAAIEMAVRTLSPQLLICDELGGEEEIRSVLLGMTAGVSFVVSVHADHLQQLWQRPWMQTLFFAGSWEGAAFLSRDPVGRIDRWAGRKEIEYAVDGFSAADPLRFVAGLQYRARDAKPFDSPLRLADIFRQDQNRAVLYDGRTDFASWESKRWGDDENTGQPLHTGSWSG